MKKKYFTLIAFAGLSTIVWSQTYFQQEVNYSIHVKLDDVKNELTADEKIEYINNSPNDLPFIYMHLWPNAYKDNTTPLAKQLLEDGNTKLYYSTEEERGYIDQLNFKIDDQPVQWEYLADSIDICKIHLNKPLKSGGKLVITTPFHVKIPSGKISRMGHIGQSYQITQWYPKPAVYDRTGWNYMPYLNQGEFYSEFGSFDVSITLPKNYVLGATGDMVDGEKELEWLNQKVKETEAIISFDSKDRAFPVSDPETKTIRFKQSNVHDFAWFCDKRYHVLKGEVETPHTKHKVTTWTMFTNAEGNLWKQSIQYMNDAIHYYSLWNGDYPYNQCTAVDGTISAGGGMEYPNITVIGASGNAFQLDVVITHEVGHNWFYGMLGSNERTHAWMDEGINSFNENRYIETKYPDRKIVGQLADKKIGRIFELNNYKHKYQYNLSYYLSAVKKEDQAIEAPAYAYTSFNYGGDVYAKTAIVFDYLMAYLGEQQMDKAMQAYFDEWHFKHPLPNDFRKSIEQSTGKDLSWFFDGLINSTKKLDYKIVVAHRNQNASWNIGVKNTGQINGPIFIQGIKNKKLVGEVMHDGFPNKLALAFPPADVDYFKIDFNEDLPEINRHNNTIRTHGIFKKVEPLKLQFLGSIDNPNKTQLFVAPVAAWNNYNRWMFGAAFYNHLHLQKKFEFEAMPLFSSTTKDFAGYGRVTLNIFPEQKIQHVTVGIATTRYAFSNYPLDATNKPLRSTFNKIAPEITIQFKKSSLRSPYDLTLRYRNITIIKEQYVAKIEFNAPVYSRQEITTNFNDLTLKAAKWNTINPMDVSLNLQQGEKITKAGLTAHFTHTYGKKNKGFDVRFFAGTFVNTKQVDAAPYRFRLSGQKTLEGAGSGDYLYDNIYLGRSETSGVLGNQFTETDGGFKFYSPLGQSSKWIAALNLKSSLGNMKLPIGVYADLGTSEYDGINSEKILYNAGVFIPLIKKVVEIYFPVLISNDFTAYKKANDISYAETIRFTLNLNLLNPFDLIRNAKL